MFRKLWKTIKFIIIVVIVLICFPRSILPHKTSDQNQDDIENYLKLNEKETRLIEFKDDEESLKLKLIQLSIINDSRKKYKAGPVKLDILASRLANKMSREERTTISGTGTWQAKNLITGMLLQAVMTMYQRIPLVNGRQVNTLYLRQISVH